MNWRQALDNELCPPLTLAAQNVLGGCRCELDLQNGAIRIVVIEQVAPSLRQAVQDAVLAMGRQLRPSLIDCEVYFKRPQTTTYSSHLYQFPQDVRPFYLASDLTTFDLPLPHVFALREAEAELARRARVSARVVAFALGGVSTLSRLSMEEWDAMAMQPLSDGSTAADLTQEKFHLFPGLNWRVPGTKEHFLRWLRTSAISKKILIFDTGTEGHGLRQIFNLLQQNLPLIETASNLEVEIVGVVDGDNPNSESAAIDGRSHNNHRFILTLDYLKVPCVLSEDFQRLVGYEKLAASGYLHPLRDLGLVRLIDASGRVVQLTATDNLANVYRGYMTNPVGASDLVRQGRDVLTPEIEKAMVEQVLEQGKNGEMTYLHQAWAVGLISDADARAILDEIEARYANELAGYPRHVYSFAEKKVKDQMTGVWIES